MTGAVQVFSYFVGNQELAQIALVAQIGTGCSTGDRYDRLMGEAGKSFGI